MGWTWGTAGWPGPPARTISRPRGASASVSTMTGSRSRRCRGSRRSSGTTSRAQVQPSSHGPAAARSPERSAVDDSSALGDSDVLSAARRRRRFGGLAPRAAGGEGERHEQRDRSHPASWAPSRARGLLEVFRATQKHHGCPLTMVIPVCQTAHYAPRSGRHAPRVGRPTVPRHRQHRALAAQRCPGRAVDVVRRSRALRRARRLAA